MKIFSTRFLLAGLLGLLFLLLACTSVAPRRRPTNLKTDQGSEKMAKSPDIAFLMQAAQSGVGKVELGKIASQKATSPLVKALGAQLAEEHRKTNDQLIDFAAQRYMRLSMTMNARDQAVYEKLQNTPSAKFDKTYLKAMLKDHKADINVFKKEAKKGREEQIQSFATTTLPVLHDDLARIQGMYSDAKARKTGDTR